MKSKLLLVGVLLLLTAIFWLSTSYWCMDCGVNPFQLAGPQVKAIEFVRSSLDARGKLNITDAVLFQNQKSLNAPDIAFQTGMLTKSQVCVLVGDFAGGQAFEETAAGEVVTYVGKADYVAKLAVLCDSGVALRERLQKYNRGADWISGCGCTKSADPCCVVAVVRNI